MNKTYVIISISDYKDVNGSTRTVHCGEASTATVGTTAVTPMITYTFNLTNPTDTDTANYDVGKYVALTVAPASAPASTTSSSTSTTSTTSTN